MKKRWYDYPDIDIYYYLKTTYGGYNWEDMGENLSELSSQTFNGDLRPIYFINSNIGFISFANSETYEPKIYKTIDGGYTWYETIIPTSVSGYGVWDFFFLDEIHSWAACHYIWGAGMSIYTVDGGESWEIGVGPGYSEFWDIHFISPEQGGIAAQNHVFITEDNFETFIYHYGYGADAIQYQNESVVWTTKQNYIRRSVNGGIDFEDYQIIDTDYLFEIQFFENIGYIFGSDNTLLKYTENNEIFDDNILDEMKLSAYPNPLSSNTTFSFSIPADSKVDLSIYNIKGQKVKQIVNDLHSAGRHSVIWDGKNNFGKEAGSGVYLYKLNVNGQTKAVKKCLLLR